MHHVIQLNLDSDAQEQIRSVWWALAERGVSPRELASDGTPHVTLMSSTPFELARITKDLAALATEFQPFEITFSHFGVFLEEPVVLVLGVTHTATLTHLHRRLYDLVSAKAEVFAFAKPDLFVFHCTLGYILQPRDLPRAMECGIGAVLPRQTRVRGFDVVECGQTSSKSIASYSFNE